MQQYFGLLSRKNWILALGVGALLALTLLASGLRDIKFDAPQRYARDQSVTIPASLDEFVHDMVEIPAWKLVAFWLLVFAIVLLLSSLLPRELRRRLILGFVRFAVFVWIFFYVMRHNPNLFSMLGISAPIGGAGDQPINSAGLPPPLFEAPQFSAMAVYLITFGIVLACLIGAWRFGRWWRWQLGASAARHPLEEFGVIARASLNDVIGGRDWGNAIIRCYDHMSRVVDVKRGLGREVSMTPTEFASRLEAAGLPPEPIQRLTQLFEAVRYGNRVAGSADIDEAVSCLTAIVQFCGEPA